MEEEADDQRVPADQGGADFAEGASTLPRRFHSRPPRYKLQALRCRLVYRCVCGRTFNSAYKCTCSRWGPEFKALRVDRH